MAIWKTCSCRVAQNYQLKRKYDRGQFETDSKACFYNIEKDWRKYFVILTNFEVKMAFFNILKRPQRFMSILKTGVSCTSEHEPLQPLSFRYLEVQGFHMIYHSGNALGFWICGCRCILESSWSQYSGRTQYQKSQNQQVQMVISQRSAGLCTRCTPANAFHALTF